MKSIGLLLWLGILLASSTFAQAACDVAQRETWQKSGALKLQVEAHAFGPHCRNPIVALAVFNAGGDAIWSTSRIAQHVALLGDEHTNQGRDMKNALGEWLKNAFDTSPDTTADLPAWLKGADQPARPEGEEFGFFAGQDVDQTTYAAWRKDKLPIFCFVSGMESMACIIADKSGDIHEIGGFTFPG